MLILGLLMQGTQVTETGKIQDGGHMYRQRNITFQCKTRMTEQEEELLLSWLNSIPGSTVTFFLFKLIIMPYHAQNQIS